jgi:autophagy-related protein 101
MEPRKTPPEYFLEIFADTTTVRDVLKGMSIS